MEKENDKATVVRCLEAIQELLSTIGVSLLTNSLTAIIERVGLLLDEKAPCQRDLDEEDRDYDETLQTSVVEVVTEISKKVENGFANFGPKMMKYLALTRSTSERNLFIGCFGDCLRACPGMVSQLVE